MTNEQMSIPVLECRNITKHYKKNVNVLENFNCVVPSGKIVGLLGPNGCGKSTLIKLISGLLMPNDGQIFVCGEPRSEETLKYISYLPERTYFNSYMKVTQLLDYFSDFYEDFDRQRAENMLSDLKIDPKASLRTLSKGTKEKVQLVMVMARRAKLYLLDEPIAGVDPAAREYILSTIINNYDPSATIIITTHLIYDIEPVLDDFVFLGNGGKIILSGNADEAREQYGMPLDGIFREVFRCLGR